MIKSNQIKSEYKKKKIIEIINEITFTQLYVLENKKLCLLSLNYNESMDRNFSAIDIDFE